MTEREVLLGDLARVERRLLALELACEELLAWKAERSKPIVIEFSNPFADDSPLDRQAKVRTLINPVSGSTETI